MNIVGLFSLQKHRLKTKERDTFQCDDKVPQKSHSAKKFQIKGRLPS